MIELAHLTKRYGDTTVVDDVSFNCRPGTVTGFLGPNGAGKSTTLRMLTGLSQPTTGAARIAGVEYRSLPNPGRVVGVMLDASSQHPGRTGRESLRIASALLGLGRARADEVLEQVGLASAAQQRVGRYSLGMRQRLGLGVALLGDPAVLVLDEPGNGLDPEGSGGCGGCCATSPTEEERCCCPATCCSRSRPRRTIWRSSPPGTSSRRGS